MGMSAPDSPAATIEITIADPITSASPEDPLHNQTPAEVVIATATPLMSATRLSLNAMRSQCIGGIAPLVPHRLWSFPVPTR
jgi:hypothetical protein